MLTELASVQYPGLRGVVPGYGAQDPNDWGLGFEIRANKSPHWTGSANSTGTYGHFGQSGTMMWIDPEARLGLIALADRDFGEWAAGAWPALSDAVLAEFA
jgi:CubicO group peptidase (beta-lactamase class C family)